MDILKKQNYWIWILLTLFTLGSSNIVLGALLGVFNKKSWYANPKNWIIGLLCLIFPFFIMAIVFELQIVCLTNARLNTPGKELYLSPYIWLLCLIVPILGWIIFLVLIIYLHIWPIVMLYNGNGEKYI